MALQKINWLQINTVPPSGSTIILGNDTYPIYAIYVENLYIEDMIYAPVISGGTFYGNASGLTHLPSGYKVHTQNTPSTTWNFNHNLGKQFIPITVYDTSGSMVIPSDIKCVDNDNATIEFAYPFQGVAVATYGEDSTP